MEICKGDGDCIASKYIDGHEMSCKNNCKPRNCLNFLVCNSNQANSIMIQGGELCFSCDIAFIKPLVVIEDAMCQICSSQNIQTIKRFNCYHALCLTCFKKAYYGDPPLKPKFPYDRQAETEYLENEWDPRWNNDPLIKKYHADYEAWVEKLHANFKECEPMRECKVCK